MSTLMGFFSGVLVAVALVNFYPALLPTSAASTAAESVTGPAPLDILAAGAAEVATVSGKVVAALEPLADAVEATREVAATAASIAPEPVSTPMVAAQELAAVPEVNASDNSQANQPDPGAALEQSWAEYASTAAALQPARDFPWQECFERAAAAHQVPQTLLLAVASGESGFDPAAISNRQAIGLMQIRWPQTSQHLGVPRQADLFDPCRNVDAGARYLVELRERYAGNLHLAVAVYNYGPSRVAPGRVPDGAHWYSQYIYGHLEQVLGREPTAGAARKTVAAGGGQQVLMTFTQAHRARRFVAWLDAAVPGLDLQQRSAQLGLHQVILQYRSEEELEAALQQIAASGITVAARSQNTNFYL